MRSLGSVLLAFALSPALFADALTDKVNGLFSAWDTRESPGCVLGVIRDGKLIHQRGYGMANLEHNIPLSPQTVFDVGSMSKQFTAMSVLLLASRGRLSLEDGIRKYVPEIPEYGSPIRIRHLLHHTSGIRDYLALAFLAGVGRDDYYRDEDVLRMLGRQKELNFKPGDEHLYSNSGYFLLSQVVRRASGESLRAFAQANIFKPLGMEHTHFHDDHTMIVKDRATGYVRNFIGGFQIAMSNLDMVGDGGVHTSVEDLLLWDRNFYQARVGGEELIRQITTPGVLNSGETLDYACGLVVGRYRGLRTVSHGGSWTGYRADMIRFPDQKFSVICLCNLVSASPSRLVRQVADLYLADQFATEPGNTPQKPALVELPIEQLREKTGTYWNAASGAALQLLVENGRLIMTDTGQRSQLEPLNQTRFRLVDSPKTTDVTFEKTDGGLRLRMAVEGSWPEVFERVHFVSPRPEELEEYAGEYSSEELEATYRVALEGGKLYFRHKNAPTVALQPTVRDHFRVRGLSVAFARDREGKVAGMSLNAGRVKNIRFVRK